MRADTTVIDEISTNGAAVLGVTSIGDELFALLPKDVDQVAVYSTINDYQLLRHLNVPDLKPGFNNDMVSCVRRGRRLYFLDYSTRCVRKYELASSSTSIWPVSGLPCGLSVTPSGNLLVTCRSPNKLVELSGESGEQVREIALHKDIGSPRHGVQLANGQFIVCHGGVSETLHRVCLVDERGKMKGSYGGKEGSDDRRLNWPRHLAVDQDSETIFVADWMNGRVLLLTSKLEFVGYATAGKCDPVRLHLDDAANHLYVGEGLSMVGGIMVIKW